MNRLTDWQSKLAAVIKQKQRDSFEWGRNDCCLFAADCIHAMTGIDPAEPYRGKYSSRLEGYKIMREFCGGALSESIDKMGTLYGYIEVKPVFAQRGDLGLYTGERDPALGVCMGSQFAYLTEKGLRYFPRKAVVKAWKV